MKTQIMQFSEAKEVINACQDFSIHEGQLFNATQRLDTAHHLFERVQKEYASGIMSLADLLEAKNDLFNARRDYGEALLNVKLATLSLMKAYGIVE